MSLSYIANRSFGIIEKSLIDLVNRFSPLGHKISAEHAIEAARKSLPGFMSVSTNFFSSATFASRSALGR